MNEDKKITCKDCGEIFVWALEEQRYYLSKRLSEPKRCPKCRQRRKENLVPDSKQVQRAGR